MQMKAVHFEKQPHLPLYQQVYARIKEDIMHGYLKKGDQLPSIRNALTMFKVSKTSIERAYDLLLLEGLINAIPQKGFFVDVDAKHIGLRKNITSAPVYDAEKKYRYDFRSATMDQDAFDMKLWRRYLKEVLEHEQIMTYGDAQGEKNLRIALADYAYSMRGVCAYEHQIVIGSSFQSLLYMLCGLFEKPCVFGMEMEGFAPLRSVCEDYGIVIQNLAVDEDGVDMAQLYQSDINVLYLHSASCGKRREHLHKKRRDELLTWAKEKNAYILEDDHNGELHYLSKMSPAMQSYDTFERVIYVGSFSKIIIPSLRISYMVLSEALQKKFIARIKEYSPTSSKIEQLALAHYIRDGHLERQVKRLRKRYYMKCKGMQDALLDVFSKADIQLDESALSFLVKISKDKLDDVMVRAREAGITLLKSNQEELILSFSAIPQAEIKDAIQELYAIINWDEHK